MRQLSSVGIAWVNLVDLLLYLRHRVDMATTGCYDGCRQVSIWNWFRKATCCCLDWYGRYKQRLNLNELTG